MSTITLERQQLDEAPQPLQAPAPLACVWLTTPDGRLVQEAPIATIRYAKDGRGGKSLTGNGTEPVHWLHRLGWQREPHEEEAPHEAKRR